MNREISISNKSRSFMDILIEPTADLIDFHPGTVVTLKFEGNVDKIDVVLLLDEGIIQLFTNQESEFLDYTLSKIDD